MKFAISVFLAACLVPAVHAADRYYVDALTGNDNNDGKSVASAWRSLAKASSSVFRPGDRLLFRAGGVWKGALSLKGSGSRAAPIVVDRYGTGPKPRLDGAGVPATVSLQNVSHWEVRGLEITNRLAANTTRRLIGVWVRANDVGTVEHIHLADLFIHDVQGTLAIKENGGIVFEISGTGMPTRFDDVCIERCHIRDIDRTGVVLKSSWDQRSATVNRTWYPSLRVRIRHNVIERSGQNGLIWRVSAGPIVEHNLFKDCGQKGSGNAAFFFNCDDAVFQFNEACGTVLTNPNDPDAGGLDADYRCKRTLIQYNYCHDNGNAGIVVVCQGGLDRFLTDVVVRYNILQNNRGNAFKISGNVDRCQIYNNTIFVGPQMRDVKLVWHKSWNGAWPEDVTYSNNIFYDLGTRSRYDLGKSQRNVFESNVFFGNHAPSEPVDPRKLTSDPRLILPGSGALGFDTLSGYKVLNRSPVIDTGRGLAGHASTGFFGNPVLTSRVDRGAHEFNGETLELWRTASSSIGQGALFCMRAAAGGPALLFASSGKTKLSTPFGDFLLDPQTTFPLAAGTVDPAQLFLAPLAIPNDPRLIAAKLHAQGLGFSPSSQLQLTNAMTLVVTR